MSEPSKRDERVLIFAPLGRDAPLAAAALRRAGIDAEVCDGVEAFAQSLREGAGAALLTREALTNGNLAILSVVFAEQPLWSDLPLIVLIDPRASDTTISGVTSALGPRANATVVERPVRAAALANLARVALRARRRQYELRDQLQAREEAEAAEREARRLAEDAMHTREVFMATVAHDLKNPLGAVHGYTQLLERQIGALDIPAQQRLIQLVARIAQTTNRAISQIDELLDLASLHANQELLLNLAPVDLVPLARQMVDDYQQTTPRHSLRFESESDELVGVWDRTRITRVLANLLANAIKYSPAGGAIEVQVGREVRDGHSLAALSVEDDGIGIPAEDLPHIFDRFYRGRNTGRELPGTGLGLASARQIIEQHGGTIEVESRPGEGSRFTVHLPLVNGD